MVSGIIGRKVGMTQVFAADGTVTPATVVKAGPCVVLQAKNNQSDGYEAVQLGLVEEKPARVNKALGGHYKKAGNVPPTRVRRELEIVAGGEALKAGDQVLVGGVFKDGERVDVIGISRGKGFQGVMKRHHMAGFRMTHGTHEFFRHGGSIGCRLTPQRVHKGKRMSGHMGAETKTVQNLQLFKILGEENCILVRGAVPGAANDYVVVTKAATRAQYKRKGMGKEEVRSKNPLKASKKAAAGRG
jgi:large subunit ribosomal protein L3